MTDYIACLDNGTDTVPDRKDWVSVEAETHLDACVKFCATIETRTPGAAFKVLVTAQEPYDQHGWAGCCVHSFDCTWPEAKEEAAEAYQEKREEKIDRLRDHARDASAEASDLHERARKMADVIPFGQPILVGHHSEGRDRRYRDRIHATFSKSFEAQNKAAYYQQRAASAASNRAIYSDDPYATDKMEQKIAQAQKLQEAMKMINTVIRKHAKEGREAQIKALIEIGQPAERAAELVTPDFCGRIGFPQYALTNNNANIRRMIERLGMLKTAKAMPAIAVEGTAARFEDDPAGNRVRLFFPGKPDEAIRGRLKAAGFRWKPTAGAWQAYRNFHTLETARKEAGLVSAHAL